MATSTLDIVINARATGAETIGRITKEISKLVQAASQATVKKGGTQDYDAYASRMKPMAQKLSMQEKDAKMTLLQRMEIARTQVQLERNNVILEHRNQLERIALELMEGKTTKAIKAIKLAEEELHIRELATSIGSTDMNVARTRGIREQFASGPFSPLYVDMISETTLTTKQLDDTFWTLAAAMERVDFEGTQTTGMFQNMARAQTDVLVKNQQMANMSAEQRIALGGLQEQVENTTDALYAGKGGMDRWNETNQKAYLYRTEFNYSLTDSVAAAESDVRATYEQVMSQEALDAKLKATNQSLQTQRMALMQSSIGMFVLGITTTQTLGALSQMVGVNTEAGKVFREMGNAIKMMLGPMQMWLAIQQLSISNNKKMLMTSLPLMAAFGVLYFTFKAIHAESKTMRVVFAALAGALATIAVKQGLVEMANWRTGISNLFKAGTNPLTVWMVPLLLTAAGAAIAGGIALMSSAPKGQTVPGYARPITETGLFYGHRGEIVGRVGSMSPTNTNNRVTVNIMVQSGATLDRGMIPQLSREIELAVASGNGV